MRISKLLPLFTISILLCGLCATAAIGNTVGPDKRIMLVEGDVQSGSLQTKHLTITYNYTLNNGQLALDGEFKFAGNFIPFLSSGLKKFSFELLFLDGKGNIIHRRHVNFVGDQPAGKAFRTILSIPHHVKAIAFHYFGETEPGPEGSPTSFWYDPTHGPGKAGPTYHHYMLQDF